MSTLSSLLDKLLQLVFPRRCPICGELPPDSDAPQLCPDCLLLFRSELAAHCPECRLPASECRCTPRRIRNSASVIDGRDFLTVCFYRPSETSTITSRLIYALKDDADDTAARILAQMMSRELSLRFHRAGEDIRKWTITYPPRSPKAKSAVGFDQAQRQARLCAAYTGADYASLFVRRHGAEQKRLNRDERAKNTASAFVLKKPDACRGARVILCDDILTTGATLSACASLLWEAGASDVIVITAAKSLPRERIKPSDTDGAWWAQT